MGAGSGGTPADGPATRQWVAAALVLAAIPAGVDRRARSTPPSVAAWALAGSALAAAVVLLAGSPPGGVGGAAVAAASGLGVGLWGGAPRRHRRRATTTSRTVPIPSAADMPRLGGLLIVGVAVGADGRGAHLPRRQHRPHRRGHRRHRRRRGARRPSCGPSCATLTSPRGGVALGIAVGRRGLVPRRSRGAAGHHRRLPAGGGAVHDRGGARHRRRLRARCAPRSSASPSAGAAQVGVGLSVAACWVLAGAAVHPSASRITEREQRRAHDLGHVRLAVLTLATASGPICAIVQHLRGEPVDGLLLGGLHRVPARAHGGAARAGRALEPGAGASAR